MVNVITIDDLHQAIRTRSSIEGYVGNANLYKGYIYAFVKEGVVTVNITWDIGTYQIESMHDYVIQDIEKGLALEDSDIDELFDMTIISNDKWVGDWKYAGKLKDECLKTIYPKGYSVSVTSEGPSSTI